MMETLPMSEMEEQDDIIEPDDEVLPEVELNFDTAEEIEELPYNPEYITFWQMIRRFFFQSRAEKERENRSRLHLLNLTIINQPDVAVNYMLRGEIHLESKHYELARDDFQQAIELAQAQFKNDKWGITAQSVMDRASEGLRKTLRHLD
jgi:hypothetical protein